MRFLSNKKYELSCREMEKGRGRRGGGRRIHYFACIRAEASSSSSSSSSLEQERERETAWPVSARPSTPTLPLLRVQHAAFCS